MTRTLSFLAALALSLGACVTDAPDVGDDVSALAGDDAHCPHPALADDGAPWALAKQVDRAAPLLGPASGSCANLNCHGHEQRTGGALLVPVSTGRSCENCHATTGTLPKGD